MRTNSCVRLNRMLFGLLFLVSLGFGQTPGDAFQRGNEFYRGGRIQDALNEYENILKQGYGSPELYFNIGNASYRLGKTAPAILAYERANRLRPGDPDIAYNLNLVNLKTVDRIEPVPELFVFQWLRLVSRLLPKDLTVNLFAASWLCLFLSLTFMYIVRRAVFTETLRWFAITGLSGIILLGGVWTLQAWVENAERDHSIVTAQVVTAKSSPDDQSLDAFVIHEGLKVRMGDSVGDWVRITLPDGKVGWIRSMQCERI